jgi:hypothetical protein
MITETTQESPRHNFPSADRPDRVAGSAAAAYATDALPRRIEEIAVLRGLGYSFREIAQPFGLTPQAINVALIRHRKARRHAAKSGSELLGLSVRAARALAHHGIRTRADAKGKDVMSLIQEQRNCGRKTRDEIARWVAEI